MYDNHLFSAPAWGNVVPYWHQTNVDGMVETPEETLLFCKFQRDVCFRPGHFPSRCQVTKITFPASIVAPVC